jgi:phosphotransferase system HPr (HPr) family protein
MKCQVIVIANRRGMHARAAASFVRLAKSFSSAITLRRDGKQANGKSIMSIMMLALSKNARAELCANGKDEGEAVVALAALVNSGFGEEE